MGQNTRIAEFNPLNPPPTPYLIAEIIAENCAQELEIYVPTAPRTMIDTFSCINEILLKERNNQNYKTQDNA